MVSSGESHPEHQSAFVYADTGSDVLNDELAMLWVSNVSTEKLRHLNDILGAYARGRGWESMDVTSK